MKLYADKEQYKLYHGNMLDMLEAIEPNSVDSIVCDPPYELNFMGKGWDNSGIAFNKDAWSKCFEVLKPGGYLLAFGGTRTYHRIACAIEDAGFEIRDCIMYLYGSGFPKSLNIGKVVDKLLGNERKIIGEKDLNSIKALQKFKEQDGRTTKIDFSNIETKITKGNSEWEGWGTALKPAYEPVIVARKPFKTSVAENIMNYGVGGINIDECRVGNETIPEQQTEEHTGRFPSNVIHDGSEEVIKDMPNTCASKKHNGDGGKLDTRNMGWGFKRMPCEIEDNGGSASRYFYCAKASRKDRDEGLDMFDALDCGVGALRDGGRGKIAKNIHPTVKPIELMQYLVRLVTPKNGIILDCFMGSGSTGKATMFENRERNANYKFIGIELTEEYLPICEARIEYAINKYEYDFKKELEEAKKGGQLNIFDI